MKSSQLLAVLLSVMFSGFVIAEDLCQEAGFSKSLYAICNAYISGPSCLDPDNADSNRCRALHKNFAKISDGEDLNDILGGNSGDTSIQATIPDTGGSIILPNVALVDFPSGAFSQPTDVTLYTTYDPDFVAAFDEFTALHRVATRTNYEVRISTGDQPPVSDTVHIELLVPQTFIDRTPDSYGVELFAMVEHGSIDETSYPIVELFPSSFDAQTLTLSADLPTSLFSINSLTGNEYEAIITIAATPGGQNIASSILSFTQPIIVEEATTSSSNCQAASISCPVGGGCTVTSPYNLARKHPVTGAVKPHYGVDYRAANGDSIIASSDGEVQKSYTSSSYGETIILRHTDGSATLYAHLLQRNVQVGDQISEGQEIGLADTTGVSTGPHLHFEYVPNGEIIRSKNRIDPDACIDVLATGSITVSDNGNLADDAFRVSLDGNVIGETNIGASNNIAISNIVSGVHLLSLYVTVAPDNVGTYQVQLNDGLAFSTGETSKSGTAPQGATVSWQIVVP